MVFFAGASAPRFHVGVVVVPQQIAWVIERLGKFQKVLDPGIHFLVPMASWPEFQALRVRAN